MEHVMKPELSRALRTLRLPVFATQHGAQAALAANEGWTFLIVICWPSVNWSCSSGKRTAFRSCCCRRDYHERRHSRLLIAVV